MIARISRSVSSFFVSRDIVPEDDREVYAYSFEILLATLINFFALVILSVASGTVLETAFFMLGFVPLRQSTGGYHAKNHFRCFLILLFSYTVFLLSLHLLPVELLIPALIVGTVLSYVIVFAFAPSADANKPFSNEETIRFKKRSRLSIFAYAVVTCLLVVFVPDNRLAFSLAMGVFTVSASLLANLIKYEYGSNRKYRRRQRGGNEQ